LTFFALMIFDFRLLSVVKREEQFIAI